MRYFWYQRISTCIKRHQAQVMLPLIFLACAANVDQAHLKWDSQSRNRVVVWKTTSLPKQAKFITKLWLPRKTLVYTDSMCAALARKWNCNAYFRTDFLTITRADMCRYMALHDVGGLYSDLDVLPLKPMTGITCTDLCVASEYRDKLDFANFFFVAAQHSPCLKRVIEGVCDRAQATLYDFKLDPHVIHNVAGPRAFYELASECAQLTYGWANTVVKHEIASLNWHDGKNYNGWIYQRMQRAGWTHVYQH